MASSSLLPNKQFNKLKVNRLDAQQIKSDSILPTTPSYLFSAIFNNSTFERTNTGGTLTVTDTDTESIIQFSDRPFRQTSNISFDAFVSLFKVSTGDNTFNEDPPNGVLTHSEEQRTYKITLLDYDLGSATFNLDLLPDETHNLNTITGRMNLFVDMVSDEALAASPPAAAEALAALAASAMATAVAAVDAGNIDAPAKVTAALAAEKRLQELN